MSNETNIFERLWNWIIGEAKAAPTIENSIATFADKFTDKIKSITSSDEFKNISSIALEVAQGIDPALVPLISGIENYVPKILTVVSASRDVIDQEAAKPLSEQAQDAVNALNGVKSVDTIAYAGNWGTVNAALQNYVISNNATDLNLDVNPGQLLAAAQVVHAHGTDEVQAAAAALPANNGENTAADPDMAIHTDAKAELTGDGPTSHDGENARTATADLAGSYTAKRDLKSMKGALNDGVPDSQDEEKAPAEAPAETTEDTPPAA